MEWLIYKNPFEQISILNSIKILKRKKIKVIVITNQSGIARGFFDENDLNKFHKQMNLELKKKNAKIDKFYFCPFHPKGSVKKYSKKSILLCFCFFFLKKPLRKTTLRFASILEVLSWAL